MPVDLVQPSLLLIGSLAILIFVDGLATRRRGKRVKIAEMILLVCTLAYVKLYHFAELWYGTSANRGDPYASYVLGSSYLTYGRGAPYNPRRGFELLKQSAEKEYVPAQLKLAAHYLTGS